ncbi:hypothetical protein FF011L_17780 [Roseimaritima multifibrata]|uniref:Lipoprotein n=1 Tax=Roseimaritima multifibrata TaxID=1930274 RepID=A0A517MDR4_9BACT|nr:hypothetical protein [Roseimaritima multifibrata]QDS93023.1 hypothetical protein FF011L_17780 [Roseimaritima multifibrata]
MKHLMLIALCAGLFSFTGCASHRGVGNHGSCQSGQCGQNCNGGNGGGLLSRLGGRNECQSCQSGVAVGCRPGPLRWQQGGLNYSEGLATGHMAQGSNTRPANPGPASGTVAYPYYTTRGPRDFLLDNPPTIGN